MGDRVPADMALSIIGYDPIGAWVKSAGTVDELLEYRNPSGISWINIYGLKDSNAISRLAAVYKIHPLTIEDILNTEHRPKVEEFDDYLFITLKEISPQNEGPMVFDQISLILTGDTVISFQEVPGDTFDGIRRRILDNMGRIRRLGADYLAYVIMDAVVDEYFLALDALGAGIEQFEDRAMNEEDTAFMADIQKVKQRLHRVRRVIWPLRESLASLARSESSFLSGELGPFIKDLHDNVIQAVETVENYRELIAGIMEVNLSTVSNRMNKIMKVLTIISTLFIPLTFIVGVYGMNFPHMPELNYPHAYPIVWGIMAAIGIGMLIFFKRRHWI